MDLGRDQAVVVARAERIRRDRERGGDYRIFASIHERLLEEHTVASRTTWDRGEACDGGWPCGVVEGILAPD